MSAYVRAALALSMVIAPQIAKASGGQHEAPSAPAEPVQELKITVPKPVQMVRTLQLMQDQIAVGSTEAHMGQRGLLTILDSRFMELEDETWNDEKSIRAAVAFVLSGGNPQVLRKLLQMSEAALPAGSRDFLEGTLAYVEGREEEARGKLLSIDLHSLPTMLSAQMALVQSALLVRSDPRKSADLLDFVRLQVPGTLLEEGALRRQVFVASQTGDMSKFLALSSAYLRRYRHSVYAGNFRQRLASVLTRIDFGKDKALFDGVVEILSNLELDVRKDLYLMAARASVDQGRTKSAIMLAEKAHELAQGDEVNATRAKLYRAAAMIVAPETIDKAVTELRSINRAALAESDGALLSSALAMAGQIRQVADGLPANDANRLAPAPKAESQSVPSPAQQASEQLQAVLKAREALNRIDSMIKNRASAVQ